MVLEKTLYSPMDCKKTKLGNLKKEISPEYSLEGMMLKLKVHTVKAMVFPVVMYGCESWTIKKAEC